MTVATQRTMSLEAYLNHDDGTNVRYELVHGVLVEMSLGTGKHGRAIRRLAKQIEAAAASMGTDWIAIQGLVGIETVAAGESTVRIPDVVVIPEPQWDMIGDRSGAATIFKTEAAPLLVIEVLSPSTRAIDLNEKQTEYAQREIAEYWLIDPKANTVKVLQLDRQTYLAIGTFTGTQTIISPTFPSLNLTTAQILTSGA